MKRNQLFSDATVLFGVLTSEISQRKEVTTEYILQKFETVLREREATAAATLALPDRRKKRSREKEKEKEQEEGEEERGSLGKRYLVAVSELQRLGYVRITSTGHQLKKLMVNWGGGDQRSNHQ
jgi:hypothetical protein